MKRDNIFDILEYTFNESGCITLSDAWYRIKGNRESLEKQESPQGVRIADDLYITGGGIITKLQGWIYRLFHRGE